MKGKLATLVGGAALGAYGLRRRPKSLKTHYSDASTKIVIVGGGFGGLSALNALAKTLDGEEGVGALLLDRVNFTTFWPMVPSAISGDIEVRHAAHSIRRVVAPLGAEFRQAEATGVDFEAREVRTDEGVFPYDYLVLAPGSRTAYFGIPGAREHTLDLKGLRDALRIRNRVIDAFEEAERLGPKAPDDLLTFVFVGGGPTGVEAAADTHDLIFDVLMGDYANVDFDRVRLVLVNAGERILKEMDPSLAHAAERRLGAAESIEVMNNTRVEEVTSGSVTFSDGRTVGARTKVWAAGIDPGPFIANLDVAKDDRGRVFVDECLRLKDWPGVYAMGDCARMDYDGPPIPTLAQAAEQQGDLGGRNLVAQIRGREPKPFRYRSLGQLVDLGSESALADILGVKFDGVLGAAIWKAVYLYELGYNLNRARVLFDWIADFFVRTDTSKLFEDPEGPIVAQIREDSHASDLER
jgi:NADH:quinone reductase (non-electrogenic)